MKRQFQIDFLMRAGLRKHHRLCDLGCGTLRGGIPMIRYLEAGHYWGIDIRPNILEEAQKELRKEGLCGKRPHLICIDSLANVELNVKFDIVWAFSALIHMTDEVLEEALNFTYRHLQREGQFYANVVLDAEHRGAWQGFPVIGRSLEEYEALGARSGLAVRDLGTLESMGHVSGRPRQDAQHMLLLTCMVTS